MRKNLCVLLVIILAVSIFSFPMTPFFEPVAAQVDHVVINEFQAKGTEWIELYNPTASVVSLVGWQIGDGEANETIDGDWGVSSIAAGGYVWSGQTGYNSSLGLSNSYDEIFLYDASDNLVDDVYYGMSGGASNKGGCPIGYLFPDEFTRSSARAPNGQDTDDYAADWTIDLSATPGTANDAPAANLGGEGIIINEYLNDNAVGTTNRSVELYNPTGTVINVTYWWFTDDSDGNFNITTLTLIGPGAFEVIPTGLPAMGDILSLFTDTHVRADQLAIETLTDGESWQRGPTDGEGPNNGYDYSSSAGIPTHLIMAIETLGASNTPSYSLTVQIQLANLAVSPTASWVWNVTIEDLYGTPLPGVTVTAEYAPYGTTSWTQFPGSPVDHGNGNYTFTHDISALEGTYHLRVNGTRTSYNPDSVTVLVSIFSPQTLRVVWDNSHNQFWRYSDDTFYVKETWELWRSFPHCILELNDQPFNSTVLTTADILIIPYIDSALTTEEMTALTNFIQNGGVIWWGGYYDMGYFNHTMNNEWISNYGFEFQNGTQTVDTSVNINDPTNNTGQIYYPIFYTFPNAHDLLTGITQIAISGTTQVYVDPVSVNTTILTTGDSTDTYWDADGSGTNNAGDLNKTNTVPLAVYEHGSGGTLIVSGSSNMLYAFDLDIGKDQFWENMYDYRVRVRTGMEVIPSTTSINVNRTLNTQFSFDVTVDNVGTQTLVNVQATLTYHANLSLIAGTNPINLGSIAPGMDETQAYTFNATADGTYVINVTVTADGTLPILRQITISVISAPLPTTPTFPTIDPFLILVAGGVVVVVVIVVIIVFYYFRRKP